MQNQSEHDTHTSSLSSTHSSPPPPTTTMTAESKPYNSSSGGVRILSHFLQAVIMVVVLALFFLFAGIASVVLLHLFVAARALRLRRRSSEGAGSGLSRADLKRIPCFSFRSGGDRAGSDSGCAVCLEGFKKGDRCRVLPGCRHCFHKGCVDKWLVKTRACPLCRSCVSVDGSEEGSIETGRIDLCLV